MPRLCNSAAILFTAFATIPCLLVVAATTGTVHAVSRSHYSKAHSLGDTYSFDPRDGWKGVNVTNLRYKYKRQEQPDMNEGLDGIGMEKRRGKKKQQHVKKPGKNDGSLGGAIKHVVEKVWNGLEGIGKHQDATITWYTGNDLKNPSCWTQSKWAPTDASFACALTLDGWDTRPRCFKFLELCNGPKKCVFVRVVDTCAGCAKGSKHIDLTRAAFGELADYDKGSLSVKFRLATEPTGWYEDLWGPKN